MVKMIIITLLFILGLCFGSFLNVLIYRLPLSLPITGRSFCPQCKKKIAWYDNIPLLSFVLLKGHCRKCHSPISWQYPAVELVTAIFFILTPDFVIRDMRYVTWNPEMILHITYYLSLVATLLVIFFSDLRYEIIPDQIVYPAIVVTLLFLVSQYRSLLVSNVLSGLLAAGFLLVLHLLTRGRGMGLGDVKLAGLMGLALGWPKIIVAFYLAFLTGAALGVILILRGKKKLTSQIPFGPFLAGATILSIFYGEAIWGKIIAGLP